MEDQNHNIDDDDLIKPGEFTDSSSEDTEDEMIDGNDEKVIRDHEMEDMNDEEIEAVIGGKSSGKKESSSKNNKATYIPGQKKLPKGTTLVADESVYVMRHEFGIDTFPAYSFDYIITHPDSANYNYPITNYISCGTQAGRGNKNQLIFAKISNLHKHSKFDRNPDADSDSDSDDDEDNEAKEPVFIKCEVPYRGGINKVRNLGNYTAVFGENKKVCIYDNRKAIEALNDIHKKRAWFSRIRSKKSPLDPIQSFNHMEEGYALDWNQQNSNLLSADNKGQIHVWDQLESSWKPNQTPYLGHTSSVEDICWQPKSLHTFCSVSSDRSIQVFDTRNGYKPVLSVFNAHSKDINVMSWSHVNDNFITTGGDDCAIKIWDSRILQSTQASDSHVAAVKFHSKPITSIDFHPIEDGVICASGEDDMVTIWDFGVERQGVDNSLGDQEIPQQLLFIHAGHENYKEVRWDRQKNGILMTTSASQHCFDIFLAEPMNPNVPVV